MDSLDTFKSVQFERKDGNETKWRKILCSLERDGLEDSQFSSANVNENYETENVNLPNSQVRITFQAAKKLYQLATFKFGQESVHDVDVISISELHEVTLKADGHDKQNLIVITLTNGDVITLKTDDIKLRERFYKKLNDLRDQYIREVEVSKEKATANFLSNTNLPRTPKNGFLKGKLGKLGSGKAEKASSGLRKIKSKNKPRTSYFEVASQGVSYASSKSLPRRGKEESLMTRAKGNGHGRKSSLVLREGRSLMTREVEILDEKTAGGSIKFRNANKLRDSFESFASNMTKNDFVKSYTFGGSSKNRITFDIGKKGASAKVMKRKNTQGRKKVVPPAMRDTQGEVLRKVKDKNRAEFDLLYNLFTASDSLTKKLFDGLDDAAVKDIVRAMYKVETAQGEAFVKQAEGHTEFSVVSSGEYRVYTYAQATDQVDRKVAGMNELVCIKRRGDFFGEVNLLYDRLATETIISSQPGLLWCLSRHDFDQILREALKRIRKHKMSCLQHLKCLQSKTYSEDETELFLESMRCATIGPSEIVVNVDEQLTKVFFVSDGALEVYEKGILKSHSATLIEGDCFAEVALQQIYKSEYVVKTQEYRKTSLYILDLGEVSHLLPRHEENKFQNVRFSITNDIAVNEAVDMGQFLILPSSGDTHRKGRTRISLDLKIVDDVIDNRRGITDVFQNSFSTVRGASYLEHDWTVGKPLLENIHFSDLQPLQELGCGNFGRVLLVRNSVDLKPGDIEYFALKALGRKHLTDHGWEQMANQERHAMSEISTQLCCPFLVKLYHSFADIKNIYFLLEYCEGGDLNSLMALKVGQRLKESEAQFYVGCIILALESLHSRNIIYRDLKPANIVLDARGYAKLTDFGLCRKATRTYTVCGTPEYMAPEMILRSGHDFAVDWWALGVLLFEMCFGSTPFDFEEETQVFDAILSHEFGDLGIDESELLRESLLASENNKRRQATKKFRSDKVRISNRCLDLINKLMNPKRLKRIGCTSKGPQAAKEHFFFFGFNWDELSKLKLAPPIVPPVRAIDIYSDYDPQFVYQENDGHYWEPSVDTLLDYVPVY